MSTFNITNTVPLLRAWSQFTNGWCNYTSKPCVFNKQVYLAVAFVRRSGVNRAEHVHARQDVSELIEQPQVVYAVIDRGYSQDLC